MACWDESRRGCGLRCRRGCLSPDSPRQGLLSVGSTIATTMACLCLPIPAAASRRLASNTLGAMRTVPACEGQEELQVLCRLLGGLAGRLATLVELSADNEECVLSGGAQLAVTADLALDTLCLFGSCRLAWT